MFTPTLPGRSTSVSDFLQDTIGGSHVLLLGCEAYHLPEHVSPHVDFVLPSVHFDTKLKRRSGSAPEPARSIGQPGVGISPKTAGTISQLVTELEQCDEYITPICLRALYGLVYEPVATELNSYGIGMVLLFSAASWSNQSYSRVHPSGVLADRSANVRHELLHRSYWKGAIHGIH